MHTILCPGTLRGTSNRVAGWISALCSGSPPARKCLRRPIGVCIMRTAVSDQPTAVTLHQKQTAKANGGPSRINQDDLTGRPSVRTVGKGGVFPCKSVQQLRSLRADSVTGQPNSNCATEVVHGKTGPAPSGAVLFGPFSWAYKKKD